MFGRKKSKTEKNDVKRPIESRDYFVTQPVEDPLAHESTQLAKGIVVDGRTLAYKDGVLIVGNRPADSTIDRSATPLSSKGD